MSRKNSIGVLVVLVALFISSLASAGMMEEPVGDVRVVFIKVAADQEYREFYGSDWQDQAEKVTEEVSQAFEREFGIRFEVREFEEWNSEDHRDIFAFVDELRKEIEPADNDLVIGFTGKGTKKGIAHVWGFPFGNYLIVGDIRAAHGWWRKYYEANKEFYKTQKGWETWEKWQAWLTRIEKISLTRIVAHELGNAFGAIDISDRENPSVMNDSLPYEKQTSKLLFDEANRRIILENKFVDFKQIAQKRNQAEEVLVLAEKCEKTLWAKTQEERKKIWLEVVSYLDEAAEIYEEVAGFTDLVNASMIRRKALAILEAFGWEREAKEEYLSLARVCIKTAQIYEDIYQVNKEMFPLSSIAKIYEHAAEYFFQARHFKEAEEAMKRAGEVKEGI